MIERKLKVMDFSLSSEKEVKIAKPSKRNEHNLLSDYMSRSCSGTQTARFRHLLSSFELLCYFKVPQKTFS
jgi:hypothetical protein